MSRKPEYKNNWSSRHMCNLEIVSGPAQGRSISYNGTPNIVVVCEVSKSDLGERRFWHDYTLISNDGSNRYVHSKDCKCGWAKSKEVVPQ